MTLCAAAIAASEGYIVAISDTMVAGATMSSDECTLKMEPFAMDWIAMFAGDDITQCLPVIRRAEKYFHNRANTLVNARMALKKAYQQHLIEKENQGQTDISRGKPGGKPGKTRDRRAFLGFSGKNVRNARLSLVSHTYNSMNKVATKTDAKGQQIAYTYDSIGRLTKAQHFPTGTGNAEDVCQQVNYSYDTNPYDSSYSGSYTSGRLTAVQYYGGSTTYLSPSSVGNCDTTFQEMYDYSQPGGKVGKRLRVSRSLPTGFYSSPPASYAPVNADLNSTYTFDNEGRITAVQYPAYGPSGSQTSGPDLGYAMDTMGRLNTMTDLAAQSTIISGATYGPSSELLSISGTLNETRTYNSMLQLTGLTSAVTNSPQSTWVYMSYAYSSTQNNGKITSQTDGISGEQVVYTYDALNRLASATATNSSWGQSYSYDGFGNLTAQTVTAGSAPAYSVSPDPTTNHVGSVDANGNSTASINGGTPTYDVENRLVTVGYQGAQYSYAPGNKRVWRGVWSSGTLTTDEVTFWSITGQKLATYQLSVSSTNVPCNPQTWEECFASTVTANQTGTNYYFGRKLIKNSAGYAGYVATDRLGSIGKFYPYGQEKPSATTNGTEKFTGYFRDSETTLDYADQRYHMPGTGRFLTPDPYRAMSTGSANPNTPASWNKYAYAAGDPIRFKDPRGLEVCDSDSGDCICEINPYDVECGWPGGGGGGGGGGGTGLLPIGPGQLQTLRQDRLALILASTQAILQELKGKRQGKRGPIPEWAAAIDITQICPAPLGGVYVTYQVISDTDQLMQGPSLQGTLIDEVFSYQSGSVNLNQQASVWSYPTTINNRGQFEDYVTGGTTMSGTAVQEFNASTPFGLQPLNILLGGTNSGGYLVGAQSLSGVNFDTYGNLSGSVDGMTRYNCNH